MAVINGTAASETLPGTAAADTITGAGGNDTALMGAGNDVFIWNVDDGSDTVEGGTGNDTLRFNGINVAELFTIGTLVGGDAGLGRNIGGSAMTLDDVERIELQALGGNDILRIKDLSITDVRQVAIDLSNGTPGVGDGAIDTITVEASKANNTMNLTQAGGIISVAGLAAQITLAATEATDFLEIRSLAGNDKINAAVLPAALLLSLDGGEGNDTITGSAGHDTLIGGDGNDAIAGGGGNDTLDGGNGNDTVTGGGGNDLASLGAGNDLFVWNPGDGDDKIEGGDGIDTLRFIDSAVNQEINITTNGGGRTNVLADVGVVFADLNDVERIELRLLGGEDSVMVNGLAGTDVTAVVVDLAGTSGGAASDRKFDRVGVEGNGDANSIKIASVGSQVVVSGLSAQVSVVHADKTDILDIFGNSGNDTIDGGKLAGGKLALQLFGNFGADTLIGSTGNDYVDGGDGNDLALLGAGNDFFDWRLGDDDDTVEGQAGTDTARANGDGSTDVFSLSANGARAALTDNVGNATMDLNDVENVWIRAQSGADAITVNDLSGTDVKLVSIELGVSDLALDTVTVNGTNGNDKVNISSAILITGLPYQVGISGAEADKDSITLNGLGGNDILDSSKLLAGVAPVALDGGAGNDTVIGGVNADVLFGGADNDVLKGAAGADALVAGEGNDVIDGGTDNDDLSGNNGNDTVTGGTGNDVALLGAGNDLFIWSSGDGSDTIQGGTEFDTLRLVGSKVGDTIGISANGTLTEIAAPGGANLDAAVERIDIRALDGADTVVVGDLSGTNTTEVAIDLAATLGGKAADAKVDTVTVTASSGPDAVAVSSGKEGKIVVDGLAVDVIIDHAGKTDQLIINGLGNADVIDATALAAGKVALTMNGGVGGDTFIGSAGNDTVIGGDGNDIAVLGAGNDTFIWNPGDDNDVVEGQGGFDTLRFNGIDGSEAIAVFANGARAHLSAIPGTVELDFDDIERIEIRALGGPDQIAVDDFSGTDVKQVAIDLASAAGVADGFTDMVTINGTAGNNAIKLALMGGAVSITGLSAQVTVAHASDSDEIQINVLGGNDSVNGSALKLNSIRQLVVDGGAGNDTITGGLGNDFLSGGDDNDKILGGGGDDQLFGDNGKDLLDGGTGNDALTGGAGNDVLTGGIGDDYVTGGQGDDTITGGTGRDSFQYTNLLDGHDVLIGFDGNAAGGQDVLELEQLFDDLGVLTADRAGRVSILDKGASVDVFVDTDGNLFNGFELTVATLKTADAITVGQDILVGTL